MAAGIAAPLPRESLLMRPFTPFSPLSRLAQMVLLAVIVQLGAPLGAFGAQAAPVKILALGDSLTAGYGVDAIVANLTQAHPPREYVTQYNETDATFLRRLCEEEGLYFRPDRLPFFPLGLGELGQGLGVADAGQVAARLAVLEGIPDDVAVLCVAGVGVSRSSEQKHALRCNLLSG